MIQVMRFSLIREQFICYTETFKNDHEHMVNQARAAKDEKSQKKNVNT